MAITGVVHRMTDSRKVKQLMGYTVSKYTCPWEWSQHARRVKTRFNGALGLWICQSSPRPCMQVNRTAWVFPSFHAIVGCRSIDGNVHVCDSCLTQPTISAVGLLASVKRLSHNAVSHQNQTYSSTYLQLTWVSHVRNYSDLGDTRTNRQSWDHGS